MNSKHLFNNIRILHFLLPVLLTGCAGSGSMSLVPSVTQSQATTQLERGIRAENKGEVKQAEIFLTDALRISSSIEDNPARITALVNLARLNRLNHKLESALLHIDQAIKLARVLPDHMPETSYEKALIELAQKHFEEALIWAATSLTSDNGEEKGKRLNLLARIHLASGNKNEAASFATKAREENQSKGQADEEANSLRLLGFIERENRRFGEAGKLLLEALQLDKLIGESHKIALDLEELATLASDQGDLDKMIDYLERAFSVHMNGSRIDKAAANQIKIAEIYRKTGKVDLAEKALQTAEELIRKKPANSVPTTN